jgi:hypothetical protein
MSCLSCQEAIVEMSGGVVGMVDGHVDGHNMKFAYSISFTAIIDGLYTYMHQILRE